MKSSWVFYHYTILDGEDEALGAEDHADVFESIRGQGAPYRVREPSARDANNFLMEFRADVVANEKCSIFIVGHTIDFRLERRYDDKKDAVTTVEVSADDMRFTNLIAVPRLRLISAKDGNGDRLSGNSGMGRLRAVVEWNSGNNFHFERTASHADVVNAMDHLLLEEFTFDVRPFNPHPSSPGGLPWTS